MDNFNKLADEWEESVSAPKKKSAEAEDEDEAEDSAGAGVESEDSAEAGAEDSGEAESGESETGADSTGTSTATGAGTVPPTHPPNAISTNRAGHTSRPGHGQEARGKGQRALGIRQGPNGQQARGQRPWAKGKPQDQGPVGFVSRAARA